MYKKRLYIEHISSKDQVANILTKQLPAEGHWRYAQAMGLNKPLEKGELAIEDDFDDFEDDLDIYDEWCQLCTKVMEAYTGLRLDLYGERMTELVRRIR